MPAVIKKIQKFSPEPPNRMSGLQKPFLVRLETLLQDQKLLSRESPFLLALSGGLDSMVLAHSLEKLGYIFELAHVNHGLRGADSDEDETFVLNWADLHKIKAHILKLRSEHIHVPGKSVQEAAREARYTWMDQICRERNFSDLVLAHHADDQTETLLMQFLRGAGLAGSRGMLFRNGNRIRPLLLFRKAELLAEAQREGISWREDASNNSLHYLRNQIRLEVLPLLGRIQPGFHATIARNARRMAMAETALRYLFEQLNNELVVESDSEKRVFDFSQCQNHPAGGWYLTECLLDAGFTFTEAEAIWLATPAAHCRGWTATTNAVCERMGNKLVLWNSPSAPNENLVWSLHNQPFSFHWKGKLYSGRISDQPIQPLKSTMIFSAPIDLLKFPLTWRTFQTGDKIALQGMKGRQKKVSDLLSEQGLTLEERNRCLVLSDAKGRVLWVPGYRLSTVCTETASQSGPRIFLAPQDPEG